MPKAGKGQMMDSSFPTGLCNYLSYLDVPMLKVQPWDSNPLLW